MKHSLSPPVHLKTHPLHPLLRLGLYLLMAVGSLIGTQGAYASDASITCEDVRDFTKTFIDSHLTHETFHEELSSRTLTNFIKSWDPAKNVFHAEDIDKFHKLYGKTLGQSIESADCLPILDIADSFMERYGDVHKQITEIIDTEHDFSLPETLIIDTDFLDFPADHKEQYDKWRKRIKYQHLQLLDTMSAGKVRERLKKRFELDHKRYLNFISTDIFVAFLKAFANSLDPHSAYLSPDDLEDFQIRFALSLEGIGVSIQSEYGLVRINQVIQGGAADKQGELKAGDKIIAVAQGENEFDNVIDLDLREVVRLIRGKRGTVVRLRILRIKSGVTVRKDISIVREKINLVDAQVQHHIYQIQDPITSKNYQIGVVIVPSFYSGQLGASKLKKGYRSVARDVEAAVKKIRSQDVDGLVLDFRNNNGGSLEEAIRMTGLFIPNGPVVQTKDKVIEVKQAKDNKIIYKGPLVVLVDLHSASASEIFAGAIKDHGRGLLVGDEHTFGKGTVQQHLPLGADKGAINTTTSKFYTPSGKSNQLIGITSHIAFPSLLKELEYGEKFRDNALEWDQIPPAKLLKLNYVTPKVLRKLKKLSDKRQKLTAQFLGLNHYIRRVRQTKIEGTPISLQRQPNEIKELEESSSEELSEESSQPQGYKAPLLHTDFILRETIFITADYAALIDNKPIANSYQIFPDQIPHNTSGCSLPLSLTASLGC